MTDGGTRPDWVALEADRGEALCDRYGGRRFSSLDELAADPSIEMVTIATPENAHFDPFRVLAGHGKAIYVEKPLATSLDEANTNAGIDQMSLVGASAGGPSQLFASKGAFGGAERAPDYGLALVELIQTTIEPDSWDVHGGPGTIVYYAPLHALVVRATSEVHHKIGGAVKVIRQVGN